MTLFFDKRKMSSLSFKRLKHFHESLGLMRLWYIHISLPIVLKNPFWKKNIQPFIYIYIFFFVNTKPFPGSHGSTMGWEEWYRLTLRVFDGCVKVTVLPSVPVTLAVNGPWP